MSTSFPPELSSEPGDSPTVPFPRRVVILGSDMTAWMAATLLAEQFHRLGMVITVCSGTGEQSQSQAIATTTALPAVLKMIGVDEHGLLRQCAGTYRLATMYSDWASTGRDFWQPLGMEQLRVGPFALFDIWLNERKAGRLLRPLHSYSANWSAALAGKAPHSFSGTSPLADAGLYGFHMKASGAASWFRSTALRHHVEEVPNQITKLERNDQGGITQVDCESGQTVPGDLFIDCRCADATNVVEDTKLWEFPESICDTTRVLQIMVPAPRQVPVYGRLTSVENGWMSSLPLATHQAIAFHFDCSELSDDQAFETFEQNLARQGTTFDRDEVTPVFWNLVIGHRQQYWSDNVICLGRAAALLNPVTSLEAHFQQASLELLLELFPDRKTGRGTREEFNHRMSDLVCDCEQVAELYHSPRTANPTRPEAGAEPISEARELLSLYDIAGQVKLKSQVSVSEDHIRCFLAGAGRLPERADFGVGQFPSSLIQDALRQIISANETTIKDLPLHEELLDWIHTSPFGKQAG